MKQNIAGRLAGAFMESKLTPLLMAAALGVGAWTLVTMASEEEPQIIVPLADIYLPMPGASPAEVENRVLVPLENVLSGIEGVEYVYTHAQPEFGLATVRYEVGRDMEESLVQLHSTLMKNADRMPRELGFPLVKTVTIDDVPFFTATLHGGGVGTAELRSIADELRIALEAVSEVRDVHVAGGEAREVRVELDPELRAALLDQGAPGPLERFVLLDDTWSGLLAGRVPLPEAAELLRRAARDETDPSVWRRLAGACRELARLAVAAPGQLYSVYFVSEKNEHVAVATE